MFEILANSAEYHILLDLLLGCLAAMAIGLPIYAILQKKDASLTWQNDGRVSTSPFHYFDLIGVVLITLIFAGMQVYTKSPAYQELASGQEIKISAGSILANSSVILFIAGLTAGAVAFRENLNTAYGLKSKNRLWVILTPFIAYAGLFLFMLLYHHSGITPWMEQYLGPSKKQEMVDLMLKNKDTAILAASVIAACVIAPIAEEFIFRGYMYGALKKHSDKIFAIIISSAVFSLVHGSVWAFIPLFVVGIALAVVYEITGSLWTCIILHAIFNTVSTVSMIVISRYPELMDKVQ